MKMMMMLVMVMTQLRIGLRSRDHRRHRVATRRQHLLHGVTVEREQRDRRIDGLRVGHVALSLQYPVILLFHLIIFFATSIADNAQISHCLRHQFRIVLNDNEKIESKCMRTIIFQPLFVHPKVLFYFKILFLHKINNNKTIRMTYVIFFCNLINHPPTTSLESRDNFFFHFQRRKKCRKKYLQLTLAGRLIAIILPGSIGLSSCISVAVNSKPSVSETRMTNRRITKRSNYT